MSVKTRLCILLAALLPGIVTASAQTAPSVTAPRIISLDVVVQAKQDKHDKAVDAVSGLQQQDFTLTDNRTTRPITSFKALSPEQEKVEVILLLDAVNVNYETMAYEKDEVQKFLRSNGAHLAHPTTFAVLTDTGLQMDQAFSTDANALSQSLDSKQVGLREIRRSAGIYGADERLATSLTALRQLTSRVAALPGRKIVLCISPGWPLISGVRIDLNATQQQHIMGNIVGFSTQLRQANVTLYDINPYGPQENEIQSNYYRAFLKGVSKPYQTDLADLSLQVLAVHTGGLVLQGSTDIAGMINKCVADTDSWYRISFAPAVAEHPNEYHQIEVKLDKPGLTARTRDGYYVQPQAVASPADDKTQYR